MSNILKRDVLLAQEYLGFLLLNLADLFLTGYIFRMARKMKDLGLAYGTEGNGPPAWILRHYGLTGFALYKFALVTVVVLACEGIALRRPGLARAIVFIGCLLYLLVVLYEVYLIIFKIEAPLLPMH